MKQWPPYARSAWTDADLCAFVREKMREDQHLEFKAIDALFGDKERTEMSCDVSSIANADGGTIIYGIGEKDGRANSLDGATEGSVEIDVLAQILNSRIQPPVDGLRISEVRLPSGDRVAYAYVVDIPKAVALAPHQAHDRRYYRRFGTSKKQLDHSSVVDLFKRADAPELRIWLEARNIERLPSEIGDRHDLTFRGVALLVENTSSAACAYAVFDIMVDTRLLFWGVPDTWDRHEVRRADGLKFQGVTRRIFFATFQSKWNGSAPPLIPLFQGNFFHLAAQSSVVGFQSDMTWTPHFVVWRCRAPGMNETRGAAALWLDNGSLVIEAIPYEAALNGEALVD